MPVVLRMHDPMGLPLPSLNLVRGGQGWFRSGRAALAEGQPLFLPLPDTNHSHPLQVPLCPVEKNLPIAASAGLFASGKQHTKKRGRDAFNSALLRVMGNPIVALSTSWRLALKCNPRVRSTLLNKTEIETAERKFCCI